MIDKEDLKNNSLLLVFLELDFFHLCFHQCQRGRLLTWDIANMNANAMGEYVSILILTVFVIDDNIVTCNRAADCDYLIESDRPACGCANRYIIVSLMFS